MLILDISPALIGHMLLWQPATVYCVMFTVLSSFNLANKFYYNSRCVFEQINSILRLNDLFLGNGSQIYSIVFIIVHDMSSI